MDTNALVHRYLGAARQSTSESNHSQAFNFYLLLLRMCNTQEIKTLIEPEMCLTWEKWSCELMEKNKAQKLFNLYQQICSLFDESHHLHFTLAVCLYKMDLPSYSLQIFRKCLRLKPDCISTMLSFENNCSQAMSCWHFHMLNDNNRNTLYDQAIGKTLAQLPATLAFSSLPVLDLGSGTSLLAMMAARHTKKLQQHREIHACEASHFMSTIGAECARHNGFDDSMLKTFNCSSFDLKTGDMVGRSVRYSLLVCEVFDCGFFGEGAIKSLYHAHMHLLSKLPGACILPARAIIKCALLQSASIRKRHISPIVHNRRPVVSQAWVGNDERYSAERLSEFPDAELLSEGTEVTVVDLNNFEELEALVSSCRRATVAMRATKDGEAHAIVQWFRLELDREAEFCIETAPSSTYCWQQAIYPLRDARSVREGDVVDVEFDLDADGLRMVKDLRDKNGLQLDYHIIDEGYIARLNDTIYLLEWLPAIVEFCKGVEWKLMGLVISPTIDGTEVLQSTHQDIRNLEQFCKDENIANLHHFLQTHFVDQNYRKRIGYSQVCDVEDAHFHKWSIILSTDIVAPDGMLSKQALEWRMLAMSRLNTPFPKLVLPTRVEVRAECWESDELLSRCQVVGSTSGFDIASLLNPYCMSCFSDLTADSVPHRRLTSEFVVWDDVIAEYQSSESERTIRVRVSESGRLDAVLFWFRIFQDDSDKSISTGKSDGKRYHWNQAAFVFTRTDAESRKVEKGGEIVLKPILHDAMIMFRLVEKLKS